MKLLDFFRQKRKPDRVSVTTEVVTRLRPDGIQETVRWDDLAEVEIITTDDGPWSEDVFWLLRGSDGKGGCAVPQGAEGANELLVALQRLPGFDNKAVIEAMGCTSDARFVCWNRNAKTSPPPNPGQPEPHESSGAGGEPPSVS
jgi:hypothetical protein